MSLEYGHFTVPVYWSMRSPYCYISSIHSLQLQRFEYRDSQCPQRISRCLDTIKARQWGLMTYYIA